MAQAIRTYLNGFSKGFAVIGEKTVLVDAGPSGNLRTVGKALDRIGVAPSDVSLIVLTHAHQDHIGALPALKELTGAPILCHEEAAAALARGPGESVVPRTGFAKFFVRLSPALSEGGTPAITADKTITGETDLAAYGVSARILHTPGHTSGSLSLLTDEGDAVIGDLIMQFLPGRPRLSMIANDFSQLRESLALLLESGASKFHIAHGRAVDRKTVARLLEKASD
jgi:hydroxyacylglutathione hydrolase